MATDPICGMKVADDAGLQLTHAGTSYRFCSRQCLGRFAADQGLTLCAETVCAARIAQPWHKSKILWVTSVLLLLAILSYSIPLLVPFRASLFMYAKRIWWAILLGFVLGGLIEYYVPRQYIAQTLGRPGLRAIVYAVFLGFLMSACCHGILALAIQLHKKGASHAAVVAFLLASPWANMTLTVLLLSFFGLKALFIIGSALFIAVTTGMLFQVLDHRGLIERNDHAVEFDRSLSVWQDIKRRTWSYRVTMNRLRMDLRGVMQGAFALSRMVLWWILLGMGLASLAGAYIPSHVFTHYMGANPLGLLVTLALATVIEVCSEGSSPMAFELFKQTGAFGNTFVFLMAGVVTDYTEIGLIWQNLGARTALWLLAVALPQVLLLGLLANRVF